MRQEETWCLTCRDHSPGRRLLLSVAPLSSPVFLHSQTEGKTAQQRKTYQTRQLLTAQSNDSQNANSFLQEKQVVVFFLSQNHTPQKTQVNENTSSSCLEFCKSTALQFLPNEKP